MAQDLVKVVTLEANVATEIPFNNSIQLAAIRNLGSSTIYYNADGDASIEGEDSGSIPANQEVIIKVSFSKLSLISPSAGKVEIKKGAYLSPGTGGSSGGGNGGISGPIDTHTMGYDGTTWRNVIVDSKGRQLISSQMVNSNGVTINIADGYYGNGALRISNNAEALFCGINEGSQVSGAVGIGGSVVAGIIIPTGYNGGSITFETTRDVLSNTPWYPLYDSTGALVTVAAAAGRFVALTGFAAQAVASCMYLRLKTASPVSGTTEARLLYVVVKG